MKELLSASVFTSLLIFAQVLHAAEPQVTPNLLGERSLERTGFQQAGPYGPGFDLRTDFVMPYGISDHAISLIPRW